MDCHCSYTFVVVPSLEPIPNTSVLERAYTHDDEEGLLVFGEGCTKCNTIQILL